MNRVQLAAGVAGVVFLTLMGAGWATMAPVPRLDPTIPSVSTDLSELQRGIDAHEAGLPVKPDNQARIEWANPGSPSRTGCSVVFLHGFSASHGDGDPMHREFAQRYGCNLFLPRLADHGLDEAEPLGDFTADAWLEDSAHALAVADQLGDKVYVMASSTGATSALFFAANTELIDGMVLYSPNTGLENSATALLTGPFGLYLGMAANGGPTRDWSTPDTEPDVLQYWTTAYHMSAIVQLQTLVSSTMKKGTFQAVNTPVFVGIYYKDEAHKDTVISVPSMRKMYELLGTPAQSKRLVEFADVNEHALASKWVSQDLDSVRAETWKFAEEVLGLDPVP